MAGATDPQHNHHVTLAAVRLIPQIRYPSRRIPIAASLAAAAGSPQESHVAASNACASPERHVRTLPAARNMGLAIRRLASDERPNSTSDRAACTIRVTSPHARSHGFCLGGMNVALSSMSHRCRLVSIFH
jgi:hypothetical protein